jgi:hypothetical protein
MGRSLSCKSLLLIAFKQYWRLKKDSMKLR